MTSEDEEDDEMQVDMMQEMKRLFKDFKQEIRNELKEFEKSLSFNSGKLDDVLLKMTEIQENMNTINANQKKLEEENKELRLKIRQLEMAEDELEQYTRNKNIQIDGIPKEKDENLEEMVKEIGNKMEVTIMNNDIDAIHRVPTRSKNNPEPIVVQFLTRKMRDNIIQNAKTKRINTKDLKMNGPEKPIYINEHLSRNRKLILFEARKKKYEKNYKFLWSRGGKIFIRKDENSNVIQLRSLEDLDQII
ncbi:uncharacterized protein LOC103518340 [Diaphorina citri]|uniref:Uncharacterized protein LOC103518340 n=1 Tax=Diaphorina citri TaxID=121845 RepID=A0A1S3DGR2_DIACI|nr:uncharacterized protein LOC103518340 [Diaphorina citri]